MALKSPKGKVVPAQEDTPDEPAGVQAVETGMRVLAALIALGPTSMLKTIAEHAGMPPPKAHRYLASFCRGGLVERNPATGGYRLGPLSVQLGLAALRHLSVVDVAMPALAELRDQTGYSTGLAIWGNYGPTFVRFEETNDVVIISVRAGSVMPILAAATGRVFGAYMPRAMTEPFIAAELAGRSSIASAAAVTGTFSHRLSRAQVEAMFKEVRERGLARVTGDMNKGIHALAAPVFDHAGALAGSIALLGGAGLFDAGFDSANAIALKAKAAEVSRRMGAPPNRA